MWRVSKCSLQMFKFNSINIYCPLMETLVQIIDRVSIVVYSSEKHLQYYREKDKVLLGSVT